MKKLARFFATSLLVVTLSMVAFADGGEIQGPGSPEPPPPGETQGPGTPVTDPAGQPSQDQTSSDILFEIGEKLTDWWIAVF